MTQYCAGPVKVARKTVIKASRHNTLTPLASADLVNFCKIKSDYKMKTYRVAKILLPQQRW